MANVLLVFHLFVAAGLIGVILLQRSEGGALGMGGGGPGNMMSGRSAGNVLSLTTRILGVTFFATSILLTVVSGSGPDDNSVVDDIDIAPIALEEPEVLDDPLANILDALNSGEDATTTPEPAEDTADPDAGEAVEQDVEAVEETPPPEE